MKFKSDQYVCQLKITERAPTFQFKFFFGEMGPIAPYLSVDGHSQNPG